MQSSDEEGSGDVADRIARSLPQIARYVRRRMGHGLRGRESVSDIVQSTARELLRAGGYQDRGEASFQRWLRVAAEHKIQNRARHWRSYGRNACEPLGPAAGELADAPQARPGHAVVLDEVRERLEKAIGRLSPDHQSVVRRVQAEGATYEEVAAELGRSPEAVRKLLTRALARLSTELSAEGED